MTKSQASYLFPLLVRKSHEDQYFPIVPLQTNTQSVPFRQALLAILLDLTVPVNQENQVLLDSL